MNEIMEASTMSSFVSGFSHVTVFSSSPCCIMCQYFLLLRNTIPLGEYATFPTSMPVFTLGCNE